MSARSTLRVDDVDSVAVAVLRARRARQCNRALGEQSLPRLVLHGLRLTWATLALQEGIDIKIVSERLNHSSTHVTREIYTHVTLPMQSDAAERVAARIFARSAT